MKHILRTDTLSQLDYVFILRLIYYVHCCDISLEGLILYIEF